jgi:glycosyltransferase involved in cell wall biosynthesis
MEAMALGLPVISTNVGGIPFLLTHNENAILVNDNDVLAMSEAINQLILENEKAQQIAFNARKIVEKMDWKVVKDDWSDLFNS